VSSPILLRNRLRERLLLRIYRHEVYLLAKLDEQKSVKGYTRTRISSRVIQKIIGYTFNNTHGHEASSIILHQEWQRPCIDPWQNLYGGWHPLHYQLHIDDANGELKAVAPKVPGRFPGHREEKDMYEELLLKQRRIM
jgi:hypothetical protein